MIYFLLCDYDTVALQLGLSKNVYRNGCSDNSNIYISIISIKNMVNLVKYDK